MLEFKNLRAGYGGTQVLHDVCARLAPGKLTAVIGPNGCGKSTLMKCAAGLLKPSGGEVLLNGHSLRIMSARERARSISYMPQSRNVPDISVAQLAAHGRYPHLNWGQSLRTDDRDIIRESISRVGLDAFAHRPVASLSGGERQRAYIAMMLAQQADIMLLDEPAAHLDLSGQFALMALLQELRAEGHGIAVVLHDLALALEYADEILLMQRGGNVQAGTPEEIYASGEIRNVFGVAPLRTADGKYLFYPEKAEVQS